MTGLWIALASLFNALIIAVVARRLLGTPVGWPRTIALSLIVNAASYPVFRWVLTALDIEVDATGSGAIVVSLVLLLTLGWILALQIVVLTVLEAIVPTGSVPGPVAIVRSLPARRRRTVRYVQIVAIATRHGLGRYLRGSFARQSSDPSTRTLARSVREALTDGGVTFVKLGQMLSTRPDLLPPAFVRELSTLQSDVPPEPWSGVRAILESELGAPIDEVFSAVDEAPLAAASVAQIHAARLLDGTDVVIKIQRSRARAVATADLDIIERLANRVERSTDWGRALQASALAAGFAESLREELDYRIELANMRAVAEASPALHVPAPFAQWSGPRVLVMERLTGTPLSRADEELRNLPEEVRRASAETLFTAVLRQVLVHGVFHADLHPGNIVVESDGSLGLLDFGSVGRLDTAARHSLGMLLRAVDASDSIAATDALLDLLDAPPDVDDRRLEREVGQLILRAGPGVGSGGSAQLFAEVFTLVLRHELSVPAHVAAAFRALGALEGSLQRLHPELDIVALAREEGRDLLEENLRPTAVRTAVESHLATVLPLLQRLPRRLNRITDDLEAGRFTASVRVFAHPEDRRFLTGILQQLVTVVLCAALALSGVVLIVSDGGPMRTPDLPAYTFAGLAFLFFAFVLGARALAQVFRHQR